MGKNLKGKECGKYVLIILYHAWPCFHQLTNWRTCKNNFYDTHLYKFCMQPKVLHKRREPLKIKEI